jgi:hypothetical protein
MKIDNLDKETQDFINKDVGECLERIRPIVEDEIVKAMNKVKPELLDKIEWIFEEGFFIRGRNANGYQLVDSAQVIHCCNPKIMKFFPDAIALKVSADLHNWIKQLIKHEMAHIFTQSEEEASKWENGPNSKVFKEGL